MNTNDYPTFFETAIAKTRRIGRWEQCLMARLGVERLMVDWENYCKSHPSNVTATAKGVYVLWNLRGENDDKQV